MLAAPAAARSAKTVRSAVLPEPAQRLRGQRQPVGVAGHPALPAQLALELAQPAHVVGGRPAELALDRLDVDVVQGGAGVLLAELVEQLVQLADLAERGGGVAVAEVLARRASARRGPS